MAKSSGMTPTMVIGSAVCKSLGIDPNLVKAFVLRAGVDEVMTITVEMIPERALADAVGQILKFEITEVERKAEVLQHG